MDLQSFTTMAARLRPALRASAARWLADAPRGCDGCDDVVQDTLLRLWILRDRLDGYENIDAVAMVTARRLAIDAIRRAGSRPSDELDEATLTHESDYLSPDTLLDSRMAEQLASSLLCQLPSRQALVVRMRHADGLELAEIASVTGLSEGNIRVLLSRGRQRLRQLYLSSTSA